MCLRLSFAAATRTGTRTRTDGLVSLEVGRPVAAASEGEKAKLRASILDQYTILVCEARSHDRRSIHLHSVQVSLSLPCTSISHFPALALCVQSPKESNMDTQKGCRVAPVATFQLRWIFE